MLPLLMDLTGWKVVVFGGGPVGTRKANYFAEEADVTVVGSEISDELDVRVHKVRQDISPNIEVWVEGADLVIAATDDRAINDAIARACDRLGRPCNRADGASNLMIPSMIRRPCYVVAVSTMGRSPAVSKHLRLRLEKELGPEIDEMVRLQEELRAELKDAVPDQKERERRLWAVMDDPHVWKLLSTDREAARSAAMRKVG